MIKYNKLLILVIMSLYSVVVQAHDPKIYSSIISKQNDEWTLKFSIGTSAIVNAMRAYYKDKDLVLDQSEVCKAKIHQYFVQHIDISINKHFKVTPKMIGSMLITDHACEVLFELEGMPVFTKYWDLKIDVCNENEDQSNFVKIREEDRSWTYHLKSETGFRLVLMKDEQNQYHEVNHN